MVWVWPGQDATGGVLSRKGKALNAPQALARVCLRAYACANAVSCLPCQGVVLSFCAQLESNLRSRQSAEVICFLFLCCNPSPNKKLETSCRHTIGRVQLLLKDVSPIFYLVPKPLFSQDSATAHGVLSVSGPKSVPQAVDALQTSDAQCTEAAARHRWPGICGPPRNRFWLGWCIPVVAGCSCKVPRLDLGALWIIRDLLQTAMGG